MCALTQQYSSGPVLTVWSLVTCRYSMIRMVLAPCSPFTVTKELMVKAAELARKYEGVRLHTHMAENQVRIFSTLASEDYLPVRNMLSCHGYITPACFGIDDGHDCALSKQKLLCCR